MTRDAIFAALHVTNWTEFTWVAVGLLGQMMFTMRFLVQWRASERERRSVVPVAFWYFSLAGGLVLFTYALWRRDPVFIIGGDRVVHLFAQPLADPWQKATLCNLWLTAGFTRS